MDHPLGIEQEAHKAPPGVDKKAVHIQQPWHNREPERLDHVFRPPAGLFDDDAHDRVELLVWIGGADFVTGVSSGQGPNVSQASLAQLAYDEPLQLIEDHALHAAIVRTATPSLALHSVRVGKEAMTVMLVTRQGCHLCEDALGLLQGLDVQPDLADVDSDDELHRLYDFRVPVVLLDGKVIAEGRVTLDQLRAAGLGSGRSGRDPEAT
jgi:hypothetical protein